MILALLMACSTPPTDLDLRAWLDVPGGELPFGLELRDDAAVVINGEERIAVDRVSRDGDTWTLHFERYGSTALLTRDGERFSGTWSKPRKGELVEVPLHAEPAGRRFPGGEAGVDVTGRWSVRFSSDETPAVGVFEQRANGSVRGTFLTATGDYRYLAGRTVGTTLSLSTFDGAHAFLFRAELGGTGLSGDFWSGTWWHETWTARPNPTARLPDAFAMTTATDVPLSSLSFPDLDGVAQGLGEGPRLIELFGTWCPNCNDATELIKELRRDHPGLGVVGLAFERTGTVAADGPQVRRYAALHGIDWPILIAGPLSKDEASARFPVVDRVRSYPTTLFVDGDDRIRAIHTGFSGPATGEAHAQTRRAFEGWVRALLD